MNDVELEQRVRRTYRAVAGQTVVNLDHESLMDSYGTGTSGDDQLAPAIRGGQRRTGADGLRRTTLVGLAAALAVLVGTVAVVLTGGDGPGRVATGSDVGRWEQLSASPVDTWGGGTVWTGTEVIELGGSAEHPLTAATAYDPARQSWRQLDYLPHELRGASIGVWTGDEIVAFAALAPGVSGVYDPASDEWRLLSDPAIPSLDVESYAFWTGDKVLLAGFHSSDVTEGSNSLGGGAALYDPSTGQWQSLPDAPQPLAPSSDAVWTGQEMIVVGQAPDATGMMALALDPAAGTWRALPAPPLSTREVPLVTWTGSELVVAGGSGPADDQNPEGTGLRDAAVFDPTTGTWASYPASPVAVFGDDIAANPVVAVVGSQVVAVNTDDPDRRPLVLDTATRTWRLGAPPPDSLPGRSSRTAVSTGHEVFVRAAFAEDPAGRADAMFSFTPSNPAE